MPPTPHPLGDGKGGDAVLVIEEVTPSWPWEFEPQHETDVIEEQAGMIRAHADRTGARVPPRMTLVGERRDVVVPSPS